MHNINIEIVFMAKYLKNHCSKFKTEKNESDEGNLITISYFFKNCFNKGKNFHQYFKL